MTPKMVRFRARLVLNFSIAVLELIMCRLICSAFCFSAERLTCSNNFATTILCFFERHGRIRWMSIRQTDARVLVKWFDADCLHARNLCIWSSNSWKLIWWLYWATRRVVCPAPWFQRKWTPEAHFFRLPTKYIPSKREHVTSLDTGIFAKSAVQSRSAMSAGWCIEMWRRVSIFCRT